VRTAFYIIAKEITNKPLLLGIDLKAATKFFGTKFACGSSVTGDDEIVIQGDVKDELFDIIPEKWPEIDEDFIEDLGDQKR
jgi:density-regulated protein DRP1